MKLGARLRFFFKGGVLPSWPTMAAKPDQKVLFYTGSFTGDGFTTSTETFPRTKGNSKAIPIAGLFELTGDIRCFNGESCLDAECAVTDLCGDDSDFNTMNEGCEPNPDLLLRPETKVAATAFCRSYTNERLFNIGDFATYLWDLQNNGLKLLQVRFHPVR